ncbi:accessory gene regulator ArgB-like protein [Clostridium chromiireducens]|uniref:Accessory protein regulator protein B n=1 Tax=Clostridium chromiireducens TaxID=225345 RepID=A0A1V4IE21_9CLOT|nr:accessory gene regulator B family protein [Clostridium chromiireducens]OPJ58201.1 accessory protein regulator protein B [Clostridium chromiireducens]RII32250.1 accessory regulator AgrB [Clostridium chromiireducens]
MVKRISEKIINSIATDDNYSKDELERMQYALVTISFELIKMISLIVIFSMLGYFEKVIIIAGIMCIVKPFIGGYHEETQIKCFIATVLLTAGILILSMQCNLSFISNCILIFLSIFCIWNQAPVINSKMPISRPQLIKKNRIRGLSTSILLGLISIGIYYYSNNYSIITWTLLFDAALMFNKRES